MRVGIVDDSELFGRTLSRLIEREPGLEPIAVVPSGAELDTLLALAPELVFLDVNLGEEYGIDLLPRLLAAPSPPVVIVLTAQYTPEVADQAISAGARACFPKDQVLPVLRNIAHDGLDALCAPNVDAGRIAPR